MCLLDASWCATHPAKLSPMTHSTKRRSQKIQEKTLLSASVSVFTPNVDTTRRKLWLVNTNACWTLKYSSYSSIMLVLSSVQIF